MATIRERFEALRTEAAAELVRLEREAQEAREVLAALGSNPASVEVEARPTEEQAEAAREYAAEGAHVVGKRAYHGRVMDARSRVRAALASGPKGMRHLAIAIYGDGSSHSVGKAQRVVGHMEADGHVVTIDGGIVRMA